MLPYIYFPIDLVNMVSFSGFTMYIDYVRYGPDNHYFGYIHDFHRTTRIYIHDHKTIK